MNEIQERLQRIEKSYRLNDDFAWLLQLAKDAVGMAEFYADERNWWQDQIESDDLSVFDDFSEDGTAKGGKRARDFLGKLKGELK